MTFENGKKLLKIVKIPLVSEYEKGKKRRENKKKPRISGFLLWS